MEQKYSKYSSLQHHPPSFETFEINEYDNTGTMVEEGLEGFTHTRL